MPRYTTVPHCFLLRLSHNHDMAPSICWTLANHIVCSLRSTRVSIYDIEGFSFQRTAKFSAARLRLQDARLCRLLVTLATHSHAVLCECENPAGGFVHKIALLLHSKAERSRAIITRSLHHGYSKDVQVRRALFYSLAFVCQRCCVDTEERLRWRGCVSNPLPRLLQ